MSNRVPTVTQISWLATIPQFVALAGAMAAGVWITQSLEGILWGCAAYLVYSFGSRQLIPRDHRRGIRLSTARRYEEAIPYHAASYEFFTRHAWLDRYRSITMMSRGSMSFREMALLNIAFAHGQIGNGQEAKAYYRRTLDEFPDSGMADAALKLMEAAERSAKPETESHSSHSTHEAQS